MFWTEKTAGDEIITSDSKSSQENYQNVDETKG